MAAHRTQMNEGLARLLTGSAAGPFIFASGRIRPQLSPRRRAARSQAPPRDFACWRNIAAVFESLAECSSTLLRPPMTKRGAQSTSFCSYASGRIRTCGDRSRVVYSHVHLTTLPPTQTTYLTTFTKHYTHFAFDFTPPWRGKLCHRRPRGDYTADATFARERAERERFALLRTSNVNSPSFGDVSTWTEPPSKTPRDTIIFAIAVKIFV